jgi:hypothetical protein
VSHTLKNQRGRAAFFLKQVGRKKQKNYACWLFEVQTILNQAHQLPKAQLLPVLYEQ